MVEDLSYICSMAHIGWESPLVKQVGSSFFHPISGFFSVSGQLGRIATAQIPPLQTGTLSICFFESCYMPKKRLSLQAPFSKNSKKLLYVCPLKLPKTSHISLLKLDFQSNNHPYGLSISVIFVLNLFKVFHIYDYQSYTHIPVKNQFRKFPPNFL